MVAVVAAAAGGMLTSTAAGSVGKSSNETLTHPSGKTPARTNPYE